MELVIALMVMRCAASEGQVGGWLASHTSRNKETARKIQNLKTSPPDPDRLTFIATDISCVNWHWLPELFLSPRWKIHHRLLLVFNAAPSEGLKVTNNVGLQYWPLCKEVSCRYTFTSIVWELSNYSSTQSFTKWRTSCHRCLWTSESFRSLLLCPFMVLSSVTI